MKAKKTPDRILLGRIAVALGFGEDEPIYPETLVDRAQLAGECMERAYQQLKRDLTERITKRGIEIGEDMLVNGYGDSSEKKH